MPIREINRKATNKEATLNVAAVTARVIFERDSIASIPPTLPFYMKLPSSASPLPISLTAFASKSSLIFGGLEEVEGMGLDILRCQSLIATCDKGRPPVQLVPPNRSQRRSPLVRDIGDKLVYDGTRKRNDLERARSSALGTPHSIYVTSLNPNL
jgi:hypothetical protein